MEMITYGDDSIMAINKEWHMKHKMPKNPTFEERVSWHIEHSKNCDCRPIPEKLLNEMNLKKSSKK